MWILRQELATIGTWSAPELLREAAPQVLRSGCSFATLDPVEALRHISERHRQTLEKLALNFLEKLSDYSEPVGGTVVGERSIARGRRHRRASFSNADTQLRQDECGSPPRDDVCVWISMLYFTLTVWLVQTCSCYDTGSYHISFGRLSWGVVELG